MYSSINIIIPVYNEGDNITSTLAEIEAKVKIPYHIFIIYDFDGDNTIPVIKKHISDKNVFNISLVKNTYGKGVLNAIKTGFDSVDDSAILVTMADTSDDYTTVSKMTEKLNQGYDLVCGSRYTKGGKQIGGPFIKKIISRIAGVSLHYLAAIPTYDVTNSFKMYTKKVIDDINIESDGGFELGMEIVVKAFAKGYKITEVPTIWRGRTAGGSRFRMAKWLPKYLRWYWFAVKNRFSG